MSLLITCFLLLVIDSTAGVGTTGAQFLKIGPSARALGMGGTFGAVSDDVYAIHFNPSGLCQLNKDEVSMTYLKYFGDVNYGFVGYAKPSERNVLGFALTYLVVDKIEARQSDTLQADRLFNAKDIALTFAYAKKEPLGINLSNLDLGGNLRLITSEIDSNIAYTMSLDIGAYYIPMEKLSLALVLQNISWGIKYKDVSDMLPLNLKLAGAYKVKENLILSSDIDTYLIDSKFYISLGGEFFPIKQLALRLGYRYGYDTASLGSIVGLGVGLGFRIWNFGLDYAFVPFGELGDTHRVSFTIKF
ncbi:MAG: PorV/PorQ family protein [Endomicrobiia bacterium]